VLHRWQSAASFGLDDRIPALKHIAAWLLFTAVLLGLQTWQNHRQQSRFSVQCVKFGLRRFLVRTTCDAI